MKSAIDSNRESKRSLSNSSDDDNAAKKNKKQYPKIKGNKDVFCWTCHRSGNIASCSRCPRSYHLKCGHLEKVPDNNKWICPECAIVQNANEKASRTPTKLKLLSKLLGFVIDRIKKVDGSEHFCIPVDTNKWHDYLDHVIKPMDMPKLEHNVNRNLYKTTEEFIADFRWLVHDSYVYNSVHSVYTKIAKSMLAVAKQECDEIKNCADCYLHAYSLEVDEWFSEPCKPPHVLVWAQLSGFPYWPGKVMRNLGEKIVDVRFFGDHSRANVPTTSCFLYSRMMPCSVKKNHPKIADGIEEIEEHVKKLKHLYGSFHYARYRVKYETKEEDINRKLQLPGYRGAVDTPEFLAQVESLRSTRMLLDHELKTEMKTCYQRKASLPMKRKSTDQSSTPGTKRMLVQLNTPTGPKCAILNWSGSESDSSPKHVSEKLIDNKSGSSKKSIGEQDSHSPAIKTFAKSPDRVNEVSKLMQNKLAPSKRSITDKINHSPPFKTFNSANRNNEVSNQTHQKSVDDEVIKQVVSTSPKELVDIYNTISPNKKSSDKGSFIIGTLSRKLFPALSDAKSALVESTEPKNESTSAGNNFAEILPDSSLADGSSESETDSEAMVILTTESSPVRNTSVSRENDSLPEDITNTPKELDSDKLDTIATSRAGNAKEKENPDKPEPTQQESSKSEKPTTPKEVESEASLQEELTREKADPTAVEAKNSDGEPIIRSNGVFDLLNGDLTHLYDNLDTQDYNLSSEGSDPNESFTESAEGADCDDVDTKESCDITSEPDRISEPNKESSVELLPSNCAIDDVFVDGSSKKPLSKTGPIEESSRDRSVESSCFSSESGKITAKSDQPIVKTSSENIVVSTILNESGGSEIVPRCSLASVEESGGKPSAEKCSANINEVASKSDLIAKSMGVSSVESITDLNQEKHVDDISIHADEDISKAHCSGEPRLVPSVESTAFSSDVETGSEKVGEPTAHDDPENQEVVSKQKLSSELTPTVNCNKEIVGEPNLEEVPSKPSQIEESKLGSSVETSLSSQGSCSEDFDESSSKSKTQPSLESSSSSDSNNETREKIRDETSVDNPSDRDRTESSNEIDGVKVIKRDSEILAESEKDGESQEPMNTEESKATLPEENPSDKVPHVPETSVVPPCDCVMCDTFAIPKHTEASPDKKGTSLKGQSETSSANEHHCLSSSAIQQLAQGEKSHIESAAQTRRPSVISYADQEMESHIDAPVNSNTKGARKEIFDWVIKDDKRLPGALKTYNVKKKVPIKIAPFPEGNNSKFQSSNGSPPKAQSKSGATGSTDDSTDTNCWTISSTMSLTEAISPSKQPLLYCENNGQMSPQHSKNIVDTSKATETSKQKQKGKEVNKDAVLPGMPLPIVIKVEPEDEIHEIPDSPPPQSSQESSVPSPARQTRPSIKIVQIDALLEKPPPIELRRPPSPMGGVMSDRLDCLSSLENDCKPFGRSSSSSHRIDTDKMIPPFTPKRKMSDVKALLESKKQFISAKLKDSTFEMLDEVQNDYELYIEQLTSVAERQLEQVESAFETDKKQLYEDFKSKLRDQVDQEITDVKRKQWCANCGSEASFHCCWNYAYCGEQCQQEDWATHTKYCTQYNMSATDPYLRVSPRFRALLEKQNISTAPKKILVQDLINTPVGVSLPSSKGQIKKPNNRKVLGSSSRYSVPTISIPDEELPDLPKPPPSAKSFLSPPVQRLNNGEQITFNNGKSAYRIVQPQQQSIRPKTVKVMQQQAARTQPPSNVYSGPVVRIPTTDGKSYTLLVSDIDKQAKNNKFRVKSPPAQPTKRNGTVTSTMVTMPSTSNRYAIKASKGPHLVSTYSTPYASNNSKKSASVRLMEEKELATILNRNHAREIPHYSEYPY